MRNIPLGFLDEEILHHIALHKTAKANEINGFANLAGTQTALRGLHSLSEIWAGMKIVTKWGVDQLEKLMEMDGPNSIMNLERSLRSRDYQRKSS